jgi:homoserine O-succinyltransferase/O-acetyltransferase
MSVRVDSGRLSNDRSESAELPPRKPPSQHAERSSRALKIGLINNMPDAAFKATERQFIALLDAASEGIPVRLSLYALPGVPSLESFGHRYGSRYSSVDKLWNTRLDGLIVTGREPLAADLRDEPYWDSFTKVLEWARENTYSTVWSCLAAHAAILHMDGIARRKSQEKHFGVFECARVAAHPLTEGLPRNFSFPHSRWNGIAEEDLTAQGYSVLLRSDAAGVDTFVKQENSLFVFFQGHPEYDSDTLLREYRRDLDRYLKGESKAYPLMPRGYFHHSTESALNALREKAEYSGSQQVLSSVAATLEREKAENTWHSNAQRMYRNWLEYIGARRHASQHAGQENVA